MYVIVPDALADAINSKLDKAYEVVPEAAVDREVHYRLLLDYFYDHGNLPEFTFQKADAPALVLIDRQGEI